MSTAEEVPPTVRSVVATALADAVCDRRDVLADDDSRAVVRTAADAAGVDGDDLASAFASAGDGEEAGAERVHAAAGATAAALADDGVVAEMDHRTTLDLESQAVALHNYAQTRDPKWVEALDLPEDVAEPATEAALAVADGHVEAGYATFDAAVDAASGGDAGVRVRVLAGLAAVWAGDDEGALDYVEEAMHLHADTWTPVLAGLAAEHDFPEYFREERCQACLYLRGTIDTPAGSEATAAYRRADDDEWTDLGGIAEYAALDPVGETTELRLRLSGTLPAFPNVLGYYVALGVVDHRGNRAESVERTFLDGPEGVAATERLRFERP